MRRSFRTQRSPKPSPTNETFRRILALAVLTLFIGVCLGWLLTPQVALFGELVPVVSGLLVVVVRYYFAGHERA
jgi:multisubunit Na+/H+ antiporter MnhB subunit